ncbi:cysteine and glycine-rich protein 2 binding protein [Anaeramoeba flamelloides]|uniref:Cysteine and glycine-rich protein 2 binding protein n=1 Tax=Anaeramoeba flamelloides TaxID=1746091 RepID=A0ABQ8YYW6_9EUKA|nr:cysteine and glycine-rich protein 2 binding protein [Anaeramoeba flamelloides]
MYEILENLKQARNGFRGGHETQTNKKRLEHRCSWTLRKAASVPYRARVAETLMNEIFRVCTPNNNNNNNNNFNHSLINNIINNNLKNILNKITTQIISQIDQNQNEGKIQNRAKHQIPTTSFNKKITKSTENVVESVKKKGGVTEDQKGTVNEKDMVKDVQKTQKRKRNHRRKKKPSKVLIVDESYTLFEATKGLLEVKDQLFKYNSTYYHTNYFTANTSWKKFKLCHGAAKIRESDNAGGTSVISEAMSFEVLKKMIGAKILSTENEIIYFPIGKITDYAIQVSNHENTVTLGVSVTRAMKYQGVFEREDANRLLEKKLFGVICSSENSSYPKFAKQILHIWGTDKRTARILKDVYENDIAQCYKHNTIVIVTVAKKADWLFWEKKSTNNF